MPVTRLMMIIYQHSLEHLVHQNCSYSGNIESSMISVDAEVKQLNIYDLIITFMYKIFISNYFIKKTYICLVCFLGTLTEHMIFHLYSV